MTKSALALLLGLALASTPLGGCASSKGPAPDPIGATQQTSADPDALPESTAGRASAGLRSAGLTAWIGSRAPSME
jgi:hypothetical protein